MSPRSRHDRSRRGGFTILELLVAMGIFTVLGTMAVAFMQQSLNIFYGGTRDNEFHDRMDAVLPEIRSDLQALFIGDSAEPPAPPPTEEELLEGAKEPKPPPPAAIQVRSGYVTLRNMPVGPLKDYPLFYMAFVVANGNEWSSAQLRRAGNASGPGMQPVTPKTVENANATTRFLPTGGLMEVLWIAVPDNPDQPSILTLYRGYNAPVGNPATTLLNPENFDTIAEIQERCRPVASGLLHFGALWRRAFSDSWEEDLGVSGVGETDPYTGRVWDSTRGFDPKFPFHKGKESQGDGSDDIFPNFVKLEVTLAGEGPFGYGRGDALLLDKVGPDERVLQISASDPFLAPRQGRVRWAKIGTEWLSYDQMGVDYFENKLRGRRGQRGTKKQAHDAKSWIFVGTPFQTVVELPFRDRYASRGGR